jgi:hypothetical protein
MFAAVSGLIGESTHDQGTLNDHQKPDPIFSSRSLFSQRATRDLAQDRIIS